MKRAGFFLTMVFGAAMLFWLTGCGKLEDQVPVAKKAGAQTNGVVTGPPAVTLTDGSSLPGSESSTGVVDALDGQGTSGETGGFVMRDGTVYEGGIKDHQPHGLGTATNPSGTYQKGEWRDGRPYRISGTWMSTDGTKEVGVWNYDGAQERRDDLVDGRTDLQGGVDARRWANRCAHRTGHDDLARRSPVRGALS